MTQTDGGYNIKRDEVLEDVRIVARLGEDGPIIKSLKTHGFWLLDVVEGSVHVTDLEDGTKVTNDTVFAYNLPPNMEIHVNTISGVTFSDGSRNMILTGDFFDELGMWTIELIKSADRTGANCHWFKVYQDGIFVGQRNK